MCLKPKKLDERALHREKWKTAEQGDQDLSDTIFIRSQILKVTWQVFSLLEAQFSIFIEFELGYSTDLTFVESFSV